MTAKYGTAVGSSTAAIEAPVIKQEPEPELPPRIGSSRRARPRRPTHSATAAASRPTPATSSITCLTVPRGCGTSPSNNLPGPIVNMRPARKFTAKTPIVNCVTRTAALRAVAR